MGEAGYIEAYQLPSPDSLAPSLVEEVREGEGVKHRKGGRRQRNLQHKEWGAMSTIQTCWTLLCVASLSGPHYDYAIARRGR